MARDVASSKKTARKASGHSLVVAFCLALPLLAQRGTGELRLTVKDPSDRGLETSAELINEANQVRRAFRTNPQGYYAARALPFGVYRLRVEHPGFAVFSELVEINSEVPLPYLVTLGVAPLQTSMTVSDSTTLLDTRRTGLAHSVGFQTIRERRSSVPGREVLTLVSREPGWVLEANGVLHPRGSEYETQYVIDGIPVVDNRSPTFAPGLEAEDVQSLRILTGNYPAEYGRKLGGVIEVIPAQEPRPNWHAKASFEAGSFPMSHGYFFSQYARGATAASLSVDGAHTKRYLDPPMEENDSNRGSSAGLAARFERELSGADRLRLHFSRRQANFLVPNEQSQQEAGQRQDRTSEETMGQVVYQHVFSPRMLGTLRGMARDISSRLWSNPSSTPILATQDRGFREGYLSGTLSLHSGPHEAKVGSELVTTSVREQFAYQIADPQSFDPAIPSSFAFAGRKRGLEPSLFVQDLARLGRLTFSAGLRWDGYRFLVRDSAFSPRLGIAWYWPPAEMVFHASYDRAYQIPAIENLLLASSEAAQKLTNSTTGLPVPPSRGNFYQAGFSKKLLEKVRLDANYFRRQVRNFADDDVFLNTGVSFPIAFSRATIRGFEGKLEIPVWRTLSGFVSYSNLVGTGFLPVTGGLFLEADSASLLRSTASFRITQEQRHTAHGQVRYEPLPRLWVLLAGYYGSGLPIEGEFEPAELEQRFSRRILERVDFPRGRVRPSYSFDASVGLTVWRRESLTARLQTDVLNLGNRLNLINFASLFSGTALYPPRTVAVRLHAEF